MEGIIGAADPHVLIFPLPMQGPVKSMLKLAELLSLATNDLHVTFLTTDHVHRRLLLSSTATSFQGPRFSLRTFPDGLPEDHPRGGEKFMEMLGAIKQVSHPLLREMVKTSRTHNNSNNTSGLSTIIPPVTCIISDGLYDFALDVGKEAGIQVLYFETMSPSCLLVYLSLPSLIQRGEVPFRENGNLDSLVNVPSMESFLRRRDLPDFCRVRDPTDHIMIKSVLEQVKQIQRAQGIILNTFEELDSPSISYIRSHCPSQQIYAIGPLHLHLRERLQLRKSFSLQGSLTMSSHNNSCSFWQEDTNCLVWLEKQSPKSVIYCSFGSQVVMTKDQLMEFWHGLVSSGISFLWIKRPGSVVGLDDDHNIWEHQIPSYLFEGIKKKGLVVSWAPQEQVLSHAAIGGFLTHSGWNSTMESIATGVPMACWPHYVDQLVTSRLTSEVWKLGVDIKDTCDRATVKKMVKDLMDLRKDELSERTSEFSILAKQSVYEGGSSHCSLQTLIDDLRSFKFPKLNSVARI